LKIKAKTVEYFKTISIPGVSEIVTTDSYLLKLLWTVVILFVFGFGFHNISLSVADYYKYDKITNIERVKPDNVTYPAITVCTPGNYSREYYRNGSFVERQTLSSNSLKNFLNFEGTGFYSFINSPNKYSLININNHIDTFKINDNFDRFYLDCLRFNAVTNKRVELFKASSIENGPQFFFNNFYRENISMNEYYRYVLVPNYFNVYIEENSLNSFEKRQYLQLKIQNNIHDFEIERASIETKLPEPYNSCKESSVDEPYHQMNCVEACIYKEIKNKYNCTFYSTLFTIQGLRQCVLNYTVLKTEFSANCLKACPMESCFSERFSYYAASTFNSSVIALFRFIFRDMSTLNITQIPKTDGFTFLNNIGGGLGLFMGIAFPNFIEFLQFIFGIVLIIFIRKIN